ncbi:N-acetylmuramoyl-L-alanine amidase CwlD [Paenibacillus sp. UMB4589-SE434]|uniref:N-acetylmuramoyl-L-alanine amidase CwlD n=1 Tax=Paenibacillus sp. UMB4589-SE434 TaxID=3046314 RepID=UPI002551AA86|nr:N-acetylmuramoyl-L-alanine amidase CwlD [Paenibacillus sp. UMB4589-SE434]MDK8184205.1 N-acetylmuramoyl-L-alanine amidase CwlD [Paenibacillus sp. UMB4589-SE434]
MWRTNSNNNARSSQRRQRKSRILLIPLRHVRQWLISICLVILVIVIMTADMPATQTWTYWTTPLSGKIVAIDAGHGGADGGASSRQGVIEKDINLAIALQLRDYLQQAGAVVVMTREGDYDLADKDTKGYAKRKAEDLKRRVQFISEKQADLLISIHMNSIPSNRWSGAQTFYAKSMPNNELLAKFIQLEIRRNLENTERVAKSDDRNLYLLRMLKIPSALVEVGFLSHPEESRQLADEQYQLKVAASVYKGILRYMSGESVGND